MNTPEQEYLTTRQAAERLGISLGTVQHMVESGVLDAWKTVGGHRRISVASLEAYMSRRHAAASGVAAQSSARRNLDVLVAEDDSALQMLYRLTMEKWGMPLNIRIVDNGFDGLIQVGQSAPDVLIADLMMPGMDGFEMIRRLRASPELAKMDIIVVTALDASDISAQGGLPEDVTVYGKPIPFHEIKGFLRGRLATRQRPATK